MSEIVTQVREIEKLFLNRGWCVEYGDRSSLAEVKRGAVINCGDGRNDLIAPTLFGGLWGIMTQSTGGDMEGYKAARQLAGGQGFDTGIHGDHHGDLSCGFFNLWRDGKLTEVYPYQLNDGDLDTIKDQVPSIKVAGDHQEEELMVNLVSGYTVIPKNKYFRIDPWLSSRIGIPLLLHLKVSIQTVELLSGVRSVKIIH